MAQKLNSKRIVIILLLTKLNRLIFTGTKPIKLRTALKLNP